MKAQFDFQVELRSDLGKGASRRLRRKESKFPAIVYGGDSTPNPVMLDHKKFMHALEHEAIYTHILTLHYPDQTKQQAILKNLHRHPYKKEVLHADFQRVKPTDLINIKVPLHFVNQDKAVGVRKGGLVNHHMSDIEIRCQVAKLPEFISVDITELDLDTTLHISDLKLPESATSTALQFGENDLPVVSIHMPRASSEEAETATPAATATTASTTAAKPAAAAPAKKEKK
ncbi:MAG: 50S ribosomal protein L25/general stress protein Ctc [Gammaproteobacteria bacterium]